MKYLSIVCWWLLAVWQGWAQTPRITLSDAAGQPADEVTVSVDLQQATNVSALQMGITLDEHLEYVEGSATLNALRSDGHTLSAGVKDGQLRFVIYSLGMKALKAGERPLFTFKLRLDKQPGVRTLQPTDLLLTDTDGNAIKQIDATAGRVTTQCALATYANTTIDFGRVPLRSTYEQHLTVTNSGTTDLVITQLLFSATTFSSNAKLPLTIAAGAQATLPIQFAPLKRGQQQARVRVVSNTTGVRNDITLTADPYAVNELHVADGLEGDAGSVLTIPLRVNNMDDLCGFQFEFDLPSQVSYVEGSFQLSDRKQDHLLSSSCNKGHLIALAYSPTNKAFTGSDGVIASFKVKLIGPYGCRIEAAKALLTALIDQNATNVTSAQYGAEVSIYTPSIGLDWGDIDMGRTPVTEDSRATLDIHNYGNATLRIERMLLRDGTDVKLDVTLPFELAPWESRTVTLTYNTLEKGDFSDVLQIYSNDPSNRLVEKTVSGSRYEPNTVDLQAQPTTSTEATLVLNLDNYNAVSGIQFDMLLPNGYGFDAATDLWLQDRFADFTANCQLLPSGQYRVFVYSMHDAVVARGAGAVLAITLHPEADKQITGNDCLQLSHIKVGGPDMADVQNYATSLTAYIPAPVVTAEPVARAEYNKTTKVLTFLYGAPSATEDANILVVKFYNLSDNPNWFNGQYDTFGRTWPSEIMTNATSAVVDASFKKYQLPSCNGMFRVFRKLKTITGLGNLNTSSVTDMREMFSCCDSLETFDIDKLQTESANSMSNMFYCCGSLTSLDVSHFKTDNVTSMTAMFAGIGDKVKSLDLSNFNTENVESMTSMFEDINGITVLDLTSFNTAKVRFMAGMFNSRNLKHIYVSDLFKTDQVDNSSGMFNPNCIGLPNFNYNYCDKTRANYLEGGYFEKIVGKLGDEIIAATGEPLTVKRLTIDKDQNFTANEPFNVAVASYSRKMTGGNTWATLCLPFEVTLADGNFRAFKLLSANDDAVELEEVETSIAAGMPVIIKMNEGETSLSIYSYKNEIAKETLTPATADGNYLLQGLYTGKEFSKYTDNNCYIMKGDKLMNPAKLLENANTKKVVSLPYRAYMVDKSVTPAASAKMFSIGMGGDVTAINNLNTLASDHAAYYDIQGHRLKALQKGINIVKSGNKTMKVIIK